MFFLLASFIWQSLHQSSSDLQKISRIAYPTLVRIAFKTPRYNPENTLAEPIWSVMTQQGHSLPTIERVNYFRTCSYHVESQQQQSRSLTIFFLICHISIPCYYAP